MEFNHRKEETLDFRTRFFFSGKETADHLIITTGQLFVMTVSLHL